MRQRTWIERTWTLMLSVCLVALLCIGMGVMRAASASAAPRSATDVETQSLLADNSSCHDHFDSETIWNAGVPVQVNLNVGMQPSGDGLTSVPCWGPNCSLQGVPDFTATVTWCGVYQDDSGTTQVGVNFDVALSAPGLNWQVGNGWERLYFDSEGNFLVSIGTPA